MLQLRMLDRQRAVWPFALARLKGNAFGDEAAQLRQVHKITQLEGIAAGARCGEDRVGQFRRTQFHRQVREGACGLFYLICRHCLPIQSINPK